MFGSMHSVSAVPSFRPMVTSTPIARQSVVSMSSTISEQISPVNIIAPPSLVVHLAKKWLEPRPYSSAKKYKSIRIQGGRISAEIREVPRRSFWNFSVPSHLSMDIANSIISTLEVTGIVSSPLVEIISKAVRINAIHFNNCYFSCSSEEFSLLISSVSTTSLTFTGCEFSDAKMIGDGLFLNNEQIRRVVITPTKTDKYSFPNLTNATLSLWKRTVPAQIHFTNVKTSFTAHALSDVAKSLTRHHRFSWDLGRISSEAFEIPELFSELSVKHVKKVVFLFDKVLIHYKNKNVIIFKCNSDRLVTPIEVIV